MGRNILGDNIYGRFMIFIGLLTLVPLTVLLFDTKERNNAAAFLIPGVLSIVAGCFVCGKVKQVDEKVSEWQSPMQKGSLPVLFAWCFGFLAGALPFLISGKLDFIHALFESVSGWSTTGLTVIDVATTPRIFLFHRSFMQYCGGLGFILMMLILVQSKQAVNLFAAEGHPDRLMPNLKKTVQIIFFLYNAFLVLGTLLYRIFGMAWFDAICHTMSALSTAGFTTQQNSIGEYKNFAIETVTIILMLIGSTNFAVLLLLSRFRLRKMFRVTELRFLGALLLIFTPLIAFSLMGSLGMSLGESLLKALFGVITTFSTTGYSTMDYALWPPFAVGLLFPLMIIGGGVGSTAGGIKLSRTYLLLTAVRENIRKRFSSSRRVTSLYYYRAQGKTKIDHALISDTVGFAACYFGVLLVGTLLITVAEGCPLMDAMFEFTSAFGTVGISNGLTATANTGTLIVEMIGMVLGRLEMFIVFIGVYSAAAKIKSKIEKRF
ncbi:TrkH family potassium uptake protein [Lachnospiraceae bacterium ZAX-1]